MIDYAEHIVVLLTALVGAWGIVWKSKRDFAATHVSSEAQARSTFRVHLMEEVTNLTSRLRECEEKCSRCEQDHQDTKIAMLKMQQQISVIQDKTGV